MHFDVGKKYHAPDVSRLQKILLRSGAGHGHSLANAADWRCGVDGREGGDWRCRSALPVSRRSCRSSCQLALSAGSRTGIDSKTGLGIVWGEVKELVAIAHHASEMRRDA